MNSKQLQVVIILLIAVVVGVISTVTFNVVSAHIRAIERQAAAIEEQTRLCPCAKK